MKTLLGLLLLSAAAWADNSYKRVDLLADQPDVAKRVDYELINPWGIIVREHGTIAVAENNSDRLTFRRQRNGRLKSPPIELPAEATGLVANTGPDFVTASGPARLIIVTRTGLIVGWNPDNNPFATTVAVDHSASNAVYTGVTRAATGGQDYLYVANFHAGHVEMYDDQFQLVKTFRGPTIPAGFAPFNVRNIREKIYVTYAKQLAPDNVTDEPGAGNGYIDIFEFDGTYVRRFASGGVLNSPWGIARAPEHGFARFNDDLLVANSGDGHINAFDTPTGDFLAPLRKPNNDPIVIDGLHGLAFGTRTFNDCCGNEINLPTLFFTAGPGNGAHGLFGFIRAAP